jgi:hypothetical protein
VIVESSLLRGYAERKNPLFSWINVMVSAGIAIMYLTAFLIHSKTTRRWSFRQVLLKTEQAGVEIRTSCLNPGLLSYR